VVKNLLFEKNIVNRLIEGKDSRIVHQLLLELGHETDFALDVGCGFGGYTKIVESVSKFVVGVDIKDAFDKRKISPKLDFCQADGYSLPFKSESFDAIILMDVIEHVNNDYNFLLEIKRILRNSGFLVLQTPNKDRLSNRVKKVIGKPVKYPYCLRNDSIAGKVVHLREYSKYEIYELLEKVGFKHVFVRGVWLGLWCKYMLGLTCPPKALEKCSQNWLAKAFK